ncbi:MAG: GIY-YIG nuclease family protein [Cyanobacteria bacterium P01_D01_bin.116]
MNVAKINPLDLPSLPLIERLHLPKCSAVYFVMQHERVLYIGRTINLAQRWATHQKWSYLIKLDTPVRIAWLECSDKNLLVQIEKALIQEFEPELNGKNCNPNYSQITGLIPKSLAQRFRVYCVKNELQLTEGLEIAIQEFLNKRQNQPPSTEEVDQNK